MLKPDYNSAKPRETDVLEISRRIKSGQRPTFAFIDTVYKLLKTSKVPVYGSKDDVRVALVSRFDNVETSKHLRTANLGYVAMSRLLNLRKTGTWDEFSAVSLKAPMLVDKGHGWLAVVQPIEKSDYSFGQERVALTKKVDNILETSGSLWQPEEPSLQVIEFKPNDLDHAAAILEFVTSQAPQQTEVFEATPRFRPSVFRSH